MYRISFWSSQVGYIYEDAFRELYAEKPGAEPDPVEEGAAEGVMPSLDQVLDAEVIGTQ